MHRYSYLLLNTKKESNILRVNIGGITRMSVRPKSDAKIRKMTNEIINMLKLIPTSYTTTYSKPIRIPENCLYSHEIKLFIEIYLLYRTKFLSHFWSKYISLIKASVYVISFFCLVPLFIYI